MSQQKQQQHPPSIPLSLPTSSSMGPRTPSTPIFCCPTLSLRATAPRTALTPHALSADARAFFAYANTRIAPPPSTRRTVGLLLQKNAHAVTPPSPGEPRRAVVESPGPPRRFVLQGDGARERWEEVTQRGFEALGMVLVGVTAVVECGVHQDGWVVALFRRAGESVESRGLSGASTATSSIDPDEVLERKEGEGESDLAEVLRETGVVAEKK